MSKASSNKLFWVWTNDHSEDYFVVARSSLSARRFFEDDVGFDPNHAKAKFVEDLAEFPDEEEGYASHELLEKLGYTLVSETMPTIYAKLGRTYVGGCVVQRVLCSEASSRPGVYCIRCAGSMFFKIGVTTDVGRRIKELQTGCPYLLVLDFFIACPESKTVEKQLQKALSHARTQFEWFEMNGAEYEKLRSEIRKLSATRTEWQILEYLQYAPP